MTDQERAWVAVEAKGSDAAAADVAAMVVGQSRSVIARILVSYFSRSIRMRKGLETIADGNHTDGQVRAIARRAVDGE